MVLSSGSWIHRCDLSHSESRRATQDEHDHDSIDHCHRAARCHRDGHRGGDCDPAVANVPSCRYYGEYRELCARGRFETNVGEGAVLDAPSRVGYIYRALSANISREPSGRIESWTDPVVGAKKGNFSTYSSPGMRDPPSVSSHSFPGLVVYPY